jgi:choline dehydrogenase-like flavoprotein
MLRDVTELDAGAVLQAEVGVIGAGFAGVDLARKLGRHGVRVALLESGGLEFDPVIQELTRVENVGKPLRQPDPEGPHNPYLEPVFRGESRIRQFGGTSNTWTGKWRRFEALDFAERPWIPHSGWPLDLETVHGYYDEIEQEYGLPEFDAFEQGETLRRLRALAAPAGLSVSFHGWQRQTLRIRDAFLDELRTTPTVDVVLRATATEILLADDLERVRALAFRGLDGRRFELRAAQFVLATGGLEAPRLLLASNRQLAEGIGNARGLVGRFFMDHPKHKRGVLRPTKLLERPQEVSTATGPRPCYHVSFSLSPQLQSERSLLHHALYLRPVLREQRWARLRRVARLSPSRLAHYDLAFYVEQAPNPESRLTLAADRDALGVQKLVVDWRLTQLDEEAFRRTHTSLVEAFERAGFGRLDFGPDPPTLEDTTDANHHIGATRMAATPEEGVVDTDCRVFGTANLYVATASVFPTGHVAAPTLTILALARRLADHLLMLRADRIPDARGRTPTQTA